MTVPRAAALAPGVPPLALVNLGAVALSTLTFDASGNHPTTKHGLEVTAARARVLVSSVVAQMLPAGTLVKGGIGVKLRLGEVGTRATRDLDVLARDREAFFPPPLRG